MERVARVLLVLGLLVISAQACGGGCSLLGVRGCGTEIMTELWSVFPKCYIPESVVAPTLTDVIRLRDSYLFLLEMPGVTFASVDVEETVGRQVLSVRGMVHDDYQGGRVTVRDRGGFTKLFGRKFLLPQHADVDKVSHELHNGILKVKVPFAYTPTPEEEEAIGGEMSCQVEEVPRARRALDCKVESADELIHPEPMSNVISHCPAAGDVITVYAQTDVVSREESLVFVMEMPGVESVEVAVNKSHVEDVPVLHVQGVAQDTELVRAGGALRLDRGSAPNKQFGRKFYVERAKFDLGTMSYHLSDGLLKLTLPKVEPHQDDLVRSRESLREAHKRLVEKLNHRL